VFSIFFSEAGDCGLKKVPLLAPDEVEGMEAAVHVVERPELVQRVRDHQVEETFLDQDLGKRHLVPGDRLPAPEVDVLAVPLLPVSERECPYPRVDRAPRQDGRQRFGVRAVEGEALFGEGIEVGGLDPIIPVDAEVVPPEAVYDDQYYVHSGSPTRKVLV
jgi:hypothetical protein